MALADYCPYIQEFTWKSQNVVVRGSHCNFPENNPGGESFINVINVSLIVKTETFRQQI